MQTVLIEKEGNIAIVKLNRPQAMNAVNQTMADELKDAFRQFRLDPEIRVVILTGEGRAFCAGRDLKEYTGYQATPVEDWEARLAGMASFAFIEEFDRPVIAAVNGFALAGGCEMGAACDIRIASENAKFGQSEILRGFFPGAGATYLLPRLIGKSRALELILTGDTIDAAEAYRIGLVNHVVKAEELLPFTKSLAARIASRSPSAVKTAKEAINQAEGKDLRVGRAIAMALRALCESTPEQKEGVTAFAEKKGKE